MNSQINKEIAKYIIEFYNQEDYIDGHVEVGAILDSNDDGLDIDEDSFYYKNLKIVNLKELIESIVKDFYPEEVVTDSDEKEIVKYLIGENVKIIGEMKIYRSDDIFVFSEKMTFIIEILDAKLSDNSTVDILKANLIEVLL
jgi:hypothetical protein